MHNRDAKFWSMESVAVAKHLQTSVLHGLTPKLAENFLVKFGPNRVVHQDQGSVWRILLNQLKSVIVLLLAVSAAVSFFLSQWLEGSAILIVLLVNTAIGFFTELSARESMEALRKLGRTEAHVLRDGKKLVVDSTEVVPGDVLLIEAGQVVAADARLFEAINLSIDESPLTGESMPVTKQIEPLSAETPLHARTNMIYKGTPIVNGMGRALVTATGKGTELGQIVLLTAQATEEITPLEKRLAKLGHKLIGITLLVGLLVFGLGLLQGKDLPLMFATAIALAVATIPEGLPIVATIALAKGMLRMAKKNALINKLSAVEALGSTTLILSDKTGTLTENKMSVEEITALNNKLVRQDLHPGILKNLPDHWRDLDFAQRALVVGALCNDAEFNHGKGLGDPLEVALLAAADLSGLDNLTLRKSYRLVAEKPFDAESRMMATFHQRHGDVLVAVKGAPEAVVAKCDDLSENQRSQWLDLNRDMARRGLRVIALAYKLAAKETESELSHLNIIGLVGLLDPPRQEVAPAIAACHRAGIVVVMATGDQKETALAVARTVGIDDESRIYSRLNPRGKLELVSSFQQQGHVVAVTGDGVNDAPALKKADIGIAMGLRGTQVAREVADMVLRDDSFTTIVTAILQGRVIFTNIRRFVVYLLSCNLSEVLVIAVAAALNFPLPITPLQILFLNLVTDVFPALALGMSEGNPSFLLQKPRDPQEPLLTPRLWRWIFVYGSVITAVVMGAFFYTMFYLPELGTVGAVTTAFLTLGFAQVFHVLNMAMTKQSFFNNDVIRNPYVWGAMLLCSLLLVGAVYIEPVARTLTLAPPLPEQWLIILIASLSILLNTPGNFSLSTATKKAKGSRV